MMKAKKKMMWKRCVIGLLAASMLFLMSGCGAASYKNNALFDVPATEEAAPMEIVSGSMNFNGYDNVKAEEMEESAVEEAGETGSVSDASMERKLIKTVDMAVETQKYDELLPAIQNQVKQLGGYIEHMNTYNGSAYYDYKPVRNADMTIRIPKEQLEAFVNTVSDLSNVIRRSDSVEDITLAYVDLESHRDALRTEQTRLMELLEQAETVEDIIIIEQRLSEVRYQLESMESQLRTYDNQVDYSTVYLSIQEVEILTPVQKESVWTRISDGFMESLDNIGEGFVEFGIWFVVNVPYLILVALLIAAFGLLLVWLLKKSVKPAKKRKKSGSVQRRTEQNMTESTETENSEKQE